MNSSSKSEIFNRIVESELVDQSTLPRQETSEEIFIWERLLQGSDEALAELYEKYANKLFNYGSQITTDRDLAFDIVQDVFLTLVSTKSQLSPIRSVKNYLFSSYRRRLLRQLKRNRKIKYESNYERQDGFLVTFEEDYYSISTPLTVDSRKLIENACNQLPIRQREVINFYFFEQLSYKEIAEIMDMSQVRSARNLLYKALKSLSISLKHNKELLRLLPLLLLLKN
ncbi:hypothetical protein GCM10007049_00880 [Echinicola pacifica]|uniref:RNA polymerase sigma factor, sigma-70 family n=1 Tax=Echinicola pacifica TaxID=346377 RepID=A0A918PLI6_9BACT|nr:sigma-70 family RNA polymerase sigma factor [Echinicola pacifica]GGZ12968.1 hypothetical protein GCM10007049_00880 [Echinicola pacifica]